MINTKWYNDERKSFLSKNRSKKLELNKQNTNSLKITFWWISKRERLVLTDEQAKELWEKWFLEWEFKYKKWEPVKFLNIDEFKDVNSEFFTGRNSIEEKIDEIKNWFNERINTFIPDIKILKPELENSELQNLCLNIYEKLGNSEWVTDIVWNYASFIRWILNLFDNKEVYDKWIIKMEKLLSWEITFENFTRIRNTEKTLMEELLKQYSFENEKDKIMEEFIKII